MATFISVPCSVQFHILCLQAIVVL